jgi:hypothetical protein
MPAYKPPRSRSRLIAGMQYRQEKDLFGEIPVTWIDVALWLQQVAAIDPGSPRALTYVKSYRVVDKIRAAKSAGQWPPGWK